MIDALDAQVVELGRDGVAEVLDSLVAGAAQALAALRRTTNGGDAVSLKRLAHTLKSNASMVGAVVLADRFEDLEQRAKTEESDALRYEAAGLADSYAGLIDILIEARSRYDDIATAVPPAAFAQTAKAV